MPEKRRSLSEEILKHDEEEPSSAEFILAPLATELDLIVDTATRSFVRSMLLKADAFWESPATYMEDTHPPDELQTYGLLLHTKRVVRIAELLSGTVEMSPMQHDCLIAAAIVHDITKAIYTPDNQIVHDQLMHPYSIDTFAHHALEIDHKSMELADASFDISPDAFHLILRLVRCSHGVYSAIPETYPQSELEKILSEADLIASQLHRIVDGDNVVMERWTTLP